MDNKRPKRRKDKYNPYTLHTEKGKYYISFTDANNCIQKVLISKKIFDSFNKFELEDISWMNEYDRHYEHSEIYESTLHERGAINVECMEEYLDNTQDMENLHMAIKKFAGSQYRVRRQRYICTNKAMKRGACDGQSAYVAHRIDGAVLATLRDYLAKIKSTPKDIALEKRYKSEISEYRRKQTKHEKEIEKLKRQVVELSAEIGRSLLGESRFTPDILSASIDNTNDLLHKKEIELNDIKFKLANQQNAMGKLDFYYSQFRTWADEFDNSTMEQKKMIACQLIKEVKVARGYELEIIFDLNYEQFLSL